jgi:hypothetical protein
MLYGGSLRVIASVGFFIFFIVVLLSVTSDVISDETPEPPDQPDCSAPLISFEAIARRFTPVSDKVTVHKYGPAYDSFLPRFLTRPEKIRLLEIGLGCSMTYGPGASIPVWREYFKQGVGGVEIHVFEIERACAEQWHHTKGTDVIMHYGDQSSVEDLKQLFGLDFDIIVDDGGHSWEMQITSFQSLFPNALKSTGIYFLEDTLTSYPLSWFPEGQFAKGPQSTVNYIKGLLDDLHEMAPDELRHKEAAALRSLACWDSICVFEKG